MVVYHLNVFIGTVLCVPHSITNVTVALMFDNFFLCSGAQEGRI
jgi:hypothetical protein